MAVVFNIKDRRVIPNWRDFRRTLQLKELQSQSGKLSPIKLNIDRVICDWNENKNIGTAADLLSSAFVADIKNRRELSDAIKLVEANKEQATKTLLELINLIKTEESNALVKKEILELDVDTIEEFRTFINNKALYQIINKTKNRAKDELYNPIVWVDLARLYALHGLNEQAEKSILTALHLAPNNRFVLRSATRFFIHTMHYEKALYYLKRSNILKKDPWLISAHIATSCIMNRFSPLIKDGIKIIESNSFQDYEITELASAIGSFEFREGSFKKAKQFLQVSMRMPNDNSLAQMEWISRKDARLILNPKSFENVINPFEALAYDYYEKGQWRDAFYNCIKWFLDVPFSKRPVILGSFISGSLLNDKTAAIILLEVGLQANPNNPTLLNNIIYDLATSGNIEKCGVYLKRLQEVDLNKLTDENKITIQATLGLVYLKNKEIELGKRLYELAISNAERINNIYLKNLAIVNYTKELILQNDTEKSKYGSIVLNMKIEDTRKDLVFLRNEVVEMIKKDGNTQPNTLYM